MLKQGFKHHLAESEEKLVYTQELIRGNRHMCDGQGYRVGMEKSAVTGGMTDMFVNTTDDYMTKGRG